MGADSYPYGASIEASAYRPSIHLYYVKESLLFLDMVISFQTAQVVCLVRARAGVVSRRRTFRGRCEVPDSASQNEPQSSRNGCQVDARRFPRTRKHGAVEFFGMAASRGDHNASDARQHPSTA